MSKVADVVEKDSAPKLALGRFAGTEVARAAAPRTDASSGGAALARTLQDLAGPGRRRHRRNYP